MDPVLNPHRCTGMNREGEPCGRAPIPGGTVCVNHGGKAPQTIAAAKRRLLAGADLAINYLLSMLEPRPPCEACGRSDADRDPTVVRAAQIVLDRAGLQPSLTVRHEVLSSPLAHLSLEEMATRAEAMAQQARRLADEEAARLLPEAEDAELIEEDLNEFPGNESRS